MLDGVEDYVAARDTLYAASSVLVFWSERVWSLELLERGGGGDSGADSDIGRGRETAEAVFVHRGEERDPNDASGVVFEPDRAIEDFGEEFVIQSSILLSERRSRPHQWWLNANAGV
jgi:hypothetical protein